jgi:molecular chaperone GrpE
MSKIYRHPTDAAGSPADQASDAPDQDRSSENGKPPEDPCSDLQAGLTAAQAESEQWRDRFLRKAAEFENFRKRTDKEKTESLLLAKSSVFLEFLPVVDACERALTSFRNAHADAAENLGEYRQGVELLYHQLLDTLRRAGVTPIEAKGQAFDPNLHEALVREESPNHEENTVLEEFRRGYLFKDRLLRPAQVKVSSRPPGEKAE